MATLARPPKPGTDWSMIELLAYNITVHREDVMGFFGQQLGPIDHLDSNLLSAADPTTATDIVSRETYRFLAYLDLASRANYGQESAVDLFLKSVLEVTRFDERGTIIRTRYVIPFTIGGESNRTVTPDACLIHLNSESMVLMVAQGENTSQSGDKSEAQLIAAAIAAFQYNNSKRAHLGLEPLETMTIPGITMIGTRPFFYKVPVTKQLSNAVSTGQYPPQPTIVACCAPPARHRAFEGMEVLDYRKVALQYFDAFHGLAKGLWTIFLDGL